MINPDTPVPDSRGLERIFVLDDSSWAPTKTLHRVVNQYLADRGITLSAQELNRLLAARGYTRTKRRGIEGYRGFYSDPTINKQPRLVPAHSQTTYRNGDRHPAARKARSYERLVAKVERGTRPDAPHGLDFLHPQDVLDADSREQSAAVREKIGLSPDFERISRENLTDAQKRSMSRD